MQAEEAEEQEQNPEWVEKVDFYENLSVSKYSTGGFYKLSASASLSVDRDREEDGRQRKVINNYCWAASACERIINCTEVNIYLWLLLLLHIERRIL